MSLGAEDRATSCQIPSLNLLLSLPIFTLPVWYTQVSSRTGACGSGSLPYALWHVDGREKHDNVLWGEAKLKVALSGGKGEGTKKRKNRKKDKNSSKPAQVTVTGPVNLCWGASVFGNLGCTHGQQHSDVWQLSQGLLGLRAPLPSVMCCLCSPAGGLSSLWCSGWMKMKMFP